MMLLEFKNFLPVLNEKPLFDSPLNLKLGFGEKLLILGPSGSGKTTIFRALLGFVPFKGEVVFKGKTYNFEEIHKIRKVFAYVPQNVNVLQGKVKDAVLEVVGRKKFSTFSEFLKKLELENSVLEKEYFRLSGGEKQRILIALALSLDREIILLDEPTSFLDKELKEKVAFLISNLEKTALIISHDSAWQFIKGVKIWNLG